MEGNIFIITAFMAGLVSFFSPCILPVLPVYLSVLTGNTDQTYIGFGKVKVNIKPILRTLLFVLGLSVVFIALGFSASFIGKLFRNKLINIAVGIGVITLGLHQMEIFNLSFLNKQKSIDVSDKVSKGYFGAFLLGLGFSLGWSPCIGPILSSILAISISESSASGVILMFVYSLGLAIPFIIICMFSSWMLKHFATLKKKMNLAKKVGGALIVIMGILILTGSLNNVINIFSRI